MNFENIKELLTNLWTNIKSNWQPIIVWGLPLGFLLLIFYFLYQWLINRRICIKCGWSQPSKKFWIKINSHLGICYYCIVDKVFTPPKIQPLALPEK